MDSEASGDRTKDEAVLVYEAAAQLLFRSKKQVYFVNRENRVNAGRSTPSKDQPKTQMHIFQAIDFVGTISGFRFRFLSDVGTIGTIGTA